MGRFTLPRDLYHGSGSMEMLKALTGKKAIVVVGGGSMKRFGFLDKAVAYLKEAGMEVKLFEGVEPDPSVETVMKCASEITMSASITARPMRAVLQYSPPATGTSISSEPFRPSAMMTWQPVENGE